MSEHTPGPWTPDDDARPMTAPEMAAENKRLRELNAELLETLKSIARRLAPGSRNMDEMMREIMFVCDITRAVIAKATGGE